MPETRCLNCNEPGAKHATRLGTFCNAPCAHEYQGWPDCTNTGERPCPAHEPEHKPENGR